MHGSLFFVFIGKVLIPLSPKGTTGPYYFAFSMATLIIYKIDKMWSLLTTFIIFKGTKNTT
jgi:hypothetical protein